MKFMKFLNARAWSIVCLWGLFACGGEDQEDKKDRDEESIMITQNGGETSSSSTSMCRPFDSECRMKEAKDREAMMDGGMSVMDIDWDDDFEILHISQGACGEAIQRINECDVFDDEERLQPGDFYLSQLCIRQEYDVALCTITHARAICEGWARDEEPDAWSDCIDDAEEARACDALVLETMSCQGTELHELPPELRKTGEACTEVDRTLGRCAMYHHDDLCQYAADRAQNPDVTYPARENSFYDCAFRQDD